MLRQFLHQLGATSRKRMALFSIVLFAPFATAQYTWIGGIGNYDVGSNWLEGTVPPNGATIRIDNGNVLDSECALNMNATIGGAAISSGDSFRINNGQTLIASGTLFNAGTIRMDSSGAPTYWYTRGGASLSGGGVVELSDNSGNRIQSIQLGSSLRNIDNVIRGAGFIGDADLTVRNDPGGTIIANGTQPLICYTPVNRGVMRAENGATLALGGQILLTGGRIEAMPGSRVELNDCRIFGGAGILTTSGSGEIVSTARYFQTNLFLNGLSSPVQNAGLLRIPNANYVDAMGTLVNSGTIRIEGGANPTYLLSEESLTVRGGGVIELSSSANSVIRAHQDGEWINVDNTIRGGGSVGVLSWPLYFTNHPSGLIVANSGVPLRITTFFRPLTNWGVMRAENGANLRILQSYLVLAEGRVEAQAGSRVELDDCTVFGGDGQLTTVGNGEIRCGVTISTLNGIDSAVRNSGYLRIENGRRLNAVGTIFNSGIIRLDASSADTQLRPTGTVTLTGGGVVEMSNNTRNSIYEFGTGALINVDNTIRGAGYLGSNGSATPITNQPGGSFVADGTVILVCDAGTELFDNQGAMRVTGSGGMRIQGSNFWTSGTVEVTATRTLTRNGNYNQTGGSTVVDGTLAIFAGSLNLIGGQLSGMGNIAGPVSNSGGRLVIGAANAIHALPITGAYAQGAAGCLVVDVHGRADGQYDKLTSTAAMTLDGTLEIQLGNGFAPVRGDEFAILSAASRAGSFAQVIGPDPGPNNAWRVRYEPARAVLTITCTADLGGDHVVSLSDLAILLSHFGTETAARGEQGDIDGDGDVDLQDLAECLVAFGNNCP